MGVLLAWQASTALRLSTQIDLNHDPYRAADETDPDFCCPPAASRSIYGETKYTAKGFKAIGAVEHGRRATWHPYGNPAT